MSKIVPVDDAIALIQDGDTIAVSGYGTNGVPEKLLAGIQDAFEADASPSRLTLVYAGGIGDGDAVIADQDGLTLLAAIADLYDAVSDHIDGLGELALAKELFAGLQHADIAAVQILCLRFRGQVGQKRRAQQLGEPQTVLHTL